MIDELLEHKHQLHKLSIDADYIREKLEIKLEGKDGFGPNLREHLRQWNQLLGESYDNLKTAYGWILQILEQENQ
jgi:hypothetical protein